MVRILRLFCALCMISLSALATPTTAISLDAVHTPGGGAALDVTRSSPTHTSISLHAPDVAVTTQAVGYENYQVFSLSGEPFVPAEGSPTVPQVFRFYRIPNTGGVDLVITDSAYDVLDNVNPMPFQADAGTAVARDEAVYSQDSWYPANVAEMTAPMVMRDFRLVGVTLYPVQINPARHQARVYRNISVDVVANNQPGENEITFNRRPSGAWAKTYRALISNLDDGALDDMTTTPGTYMILSSTNILMRPWADSLAEWKTRKGYKVVIDARGSSYTPNQWRQDILAAYQSSNPPLEYVALMGDPDWTNIGIPANYGDFDHYYASLTSDDIEDIGVGRLDGGSTNEMATINAKIMGYERYPHMQNSQGQADTMWFHKAYMQASTSWSCASNFTLMQWVASQFRLYTGVDSSVVEASAGFNRGAAVPRFNAGISFFAWRGSMEENDPGLAGATNPGWRLPITITVTCQAGEYINFTSMAENLLKAGTPSNPQGGVCGIGPSTGGTHHPENVTMTGGFFYEVIDAGVEHLGDAVAGAKAWLWTTFGNYQSEANLFSRYNNVFGDPGLSIWTDVPTVMTATHPTSLNVGARRVEVVVQRQGDDVPIQDALVCLWKRGVDSTWVVGNTDASGRIVFPVSVNAPGTMYLTVTKQNHKPYLFDIPCNNVDCMPMLCSYSVDDDNIGGTHGNNNGVVNPGETIDLPIYVKNFGTAVMATNVSATLTSSNPRVTVDGGAINYADIAPGDSTLGAQPFRIQVAQTMQNQEAVQLTLTISSLSRETSGVLELRAASGDLVYQRQQWPAGAFAPGLSRSLSVTVRNAGLVPLTGVNGHLQSLSPFVTVSTGDASFGVIGAGGLDSNLTNPFVVAANPMTFRGHQAPMLLILTGDNGFVDSTQFVVSVGTATSTDPTGPDAYGYFAYDNTDVSYELHPVFQYVNISAGLGTNLNLNDVGEKTTISQIWSTYRVLPFPVTFYGRTYDTLTICSNGWVAFGNQAWFDNARNYPIPAMQAPEAMIAPYWDDLATSGGSLGVWAYYDADSGRYIVQWKATTTGAPNGPLDFEVMLYDSAARPSMDGNNHILVQYNHAAMGLGINQDNERPGCTIGIQAPRGLVGLPIGYCDWTSPSVAAIQDGRAILFTTDARVLFGQVEGHIYDAATTQPMPGVVVYADRYGFHDTTDARGHYHLTNVMIGTYNIIASKYRFNTDTLFNVMVALDSTDTLDFRLRHPEMILSIPVLVDSARDSTVQASFTIVNHGNGPLDYASRVYFAGDHNPASWDSVGAINISGLTNDRQIWGCEFLYDSWWVTGAAAMDGHAVIYRFDLSGNLMNELPQPCHSPLGWFDMASDGHYLYGSDTHVIYGMDTTGQVHDTIPSPLNPTRAIAYDPYYDHFWVADYSSNIYEIDRQGNTYGVIQNTGTNALSITGLAWNANDPTGYKLYVFSRDGSNSQIRVTRIQPLPPHNRETAVDLAGLPGDRANGCTITSSWNSTLVVFAAILRNAQAGCRMGIYEMSFNSSWITLSPSTAVVPGGQSQPVTVTLNPAILRSDTYQVNAQFSSTVYDTTLVLPITFVVHHTTSVVSPRVTSLPKEFALHQNFPNPFNPTTQISFDLPKAAHVQLRIYNSLGQLVTTLLDETRQAGAYTLTWDARNVSTGLYLYQIRAGSFVQTKKMLLMK